MIAIIDNYDSFTYNLYQAVGSLVAGLHQPGQVDKQAPLERVQVFRNDQVTPQDLLAMDLTHLIISPGPGRPEDAGHTMEIIEQVAPSVPTLGVCLGHQAIAACFGGKIHPAKHLVHGKTTAISHSGKGIFQGIEPSPMVMRYHSLIVDPASLPDPLEVTAKDSQGQIMALHHKTLPIYGVQFHPESIGTPMGLDLLANFLRETGGTPC